jgi:TonB-linked SusC/RagA family outer membrane protein
VGLSVLFALSICGTALAQETQVSGTVTSTTGERLPGVTVQVRGTATRTETDADGRYTLTAPGDGVLLFALIGYKGAARTIAGRGTIDVGLEPAVPVLDPVIVTGYTAQRRADITGAVGSVNIEGVAQQTSTSVLQRLDGQVPGVVVENSGSPGSRTTVRIRGVSGFQNNDPLYIVDGTPVQDTYLNWLNPNEIGSINVLKDASAASIYGSRASNGVVIIETKRGRAGARQATLDVRTGWATPVRGYDEILIQNPLDYCRVVKVAYDNGGSAVPQNICGDPNNPTVPAFIYPNDGVGQSCLIGDITSTTCTTFVDTSTYSYPNNLIMPGSPGTNWWKAVFGTGYTRDANLAVSGGGDDNSYHVSFNYLDQVGTAAFTQLRRGGARVNTTFSLGRVNIGENISISREQHHGGIDDDALGEDNIIGKNIFQQPVVPIYDIAGNFASGKATGTSNLTNPLKLAFAGQHNIATNDRIFGNVFAAMDATRGVSLRTRFGFNLAQGSYHGFTPYRWEDKEEGKINGINENYNLFTEWTWSNTLNVTRTMDQHTLTVLVGQEANKSTNRFEAASCAGLVTESVDARYIRDDLCDASTKNVSSTGSRAALLSFFGKADYNFADRYFLSVTLRRDGSSRLGLTNRWGTFPAFGAGWRVSRESFFPAGGFLTNAMLRFGWGVTGNQQIPAGRTVSQFGGDRGDTFYDISGSNTSIRPGFKVVAIGNPDLKWEENRSVNFGLDLEFLDGRGTVSADVYRRNTNNLLFDPRQPATAGTADPAILNIGKMQNKGIDFSIGYHSSLGARTLWSVTFNGAHYRNKIVQIDGDHDFFIGPITLREQNPVNNVLGYPIGSFYGLVANGYYLDSLDAAPYWADGARPGRIRFVDQPTVLDTIDDANGRCPAAPGCVGLYRPDGTITSADQKVIGSPHPDFTAGLDLSLRHGNWDVGARLFASIGNDIFKAQKYWEIFRYFNTNVRADLLANAVVLDGPCTDVACPGRVTNPNAKYPRVDVNDASWSRQFSSYWIEDGSYLRLRTLQVGYSLPPALIRWIPAARVYLQAENLFTITGYSGLDPALPAWSTFGAAGDIRDQFRGVDEGSYPSNRTITIGITTTF